MVKKLVAKVGEYEKDGQTKGRYVTLGVILRNDNGEYAILDPSVNIAGCLTQQNMTNHKAGRRTGDKLMVSIFDDDNREGQSGGGNGGGAGPDLSDEIPFGPEWRA